MKRITVATVVWLLTATISVAWAQEAEPYVDKELGCTIHFPAKYQVDRVKTRDGGMRQTFVCVHEGRGYGMEVSPSPLGAKAKDLAAAREFLKDWSHREAQEGEGRIIDPHDFEIGGFAGRDFQYQHKKYKATFFYRVVVTDKHQFEVAIQAPLAQPLPVEDALA